MPAGAIGKPFKSAPRDEQRPPGLAGVPRLWRGGVARLRVGLGLNEARASSEPAAPALVHGTRRYVAVAVEVAIAVPVAVPVAVLARGAGHADLEVRLFT